MDFLEAADDLSEKKVNTCIYMLEIFARQRLMFCEKIIDRLITCIENNIQAADLTQIARIFMYYSRIKYGVKQNFIAKLVERIYIFR